MQELLAMVVLGVIGAIGTYSFLPLVVAQGISELGLNSRLAGFLAAAEMGGSSIATFLISFVVNRWNRRPVALTGLFLIMLGSAVSVDIGQYSILIFARILTGLGEGALLGAVIASMSGTKYPERNFGLWTIGNMIIASLLFFIITPRIITLWGLQGLFILYLCMAALGFLVIGWYPKQRHYALTNRKKSSISKPVVICLIAIALAFLADGGIWAYMVPLGVASGVSKQLMNHVLGAAAVAGIVGGFIAAILGSKRGRVKPNVAALLVSILSLGLVIWVQGSVPFLLAAMSFYIAWIFGLPYLMGIVAALDPSGRSATLGIVIQSVGLALGPILSGVLVSHGGYKILGWFGFILYVTVLILVIPLAISVDRKSKAVAYK